MSALPAAYLRPGSASFSDFLAEVDPGLLPGHGHSAGAAHLAAPHGTTIVAVTCSEGVVLAGDRRATMGNLVASREIEKVFVADSHSAVGIAGTAGLAVEMVRLFQLELEHYEKIEGVRLSLDGKANRLAAMIRGNLGAAMQGLAVVPLFAGVDPAPRVPVLRTTGERSPGRIFSYDVVGGKYEEHDYHAVGSGSLFARSALKKRFDPSADLPGAVRAAVEALYDAADDDTATGGPDLTRRIYPVVVAITAQGAVRWTDDAVGAVAQAVVTGRMTNPGG
ncbi:proteasome subunit beta [Nakamurella flavida]|uniref:Proteasome subunit beta n=1 Tax=Nakamurella flavida TaxID=363630 RepID=A0A939C4M7_9ACTN|nr:proteasome subunit beta [Nakamurella flavida]MDP9776962.1 proteasome beta subunit [Nakamurella flavida]